MTNHTTSDAQWIHEFMAMIANMSEEEREEYCKSIGLQVRPEVWRGIIALWKEKGTQ